MILIQIKKFYHDKINDNLFGLSGWYIIDIKSKLFESKNLLKQNCNEVKENNKNEVWAGSYKMVYTIKVDSENRLWIGNNNGIFNYSNECFIRPEVSHPAFSTRVESIDQLSDSTIVFGTKGWGVMLWKDEYYVPITVDDGLTSNMIEQVHIDETGNIWAATLNGLNKINVINGKVQVRTFKVSNGLPSNEIYKIASFKNQIWLGTSKGLVKFNEKDENFDSPQPFFQDIRTNGKSIKRSTDSTFVYNHNNWSFHFTTINFRLNKNKLYRYKISSTHEWNITKSRVANFSKLSPGDFSFEVQSQNEDSHWSESARYDFVIVPPWWKTWWAIGLFFALGYVGIFYYIKMQVGKNRKELYVKKQITHLKRSALHAQMNPHFIFNCLNSIQNLILKNDTHNAILYLSKFAELVRQILNTSIADKVSLSDNIKMIKNYLELEKLRFKDKLKYDFYIDERLEQNKISIPPLLIQPYIENAIKHGRLNEGSKGEISINMSKRKTT